MNKVISNRQNQPNQPNQSNEPPHTIIIYKTYTKAAKRAQAKYRMTDKGKIARLKASRSFLVRHRERINKQNRAKVSCPHCSKVYCKAYLPKHIKSVHI